MDSLVARDIFTEKLEFNGFHLVGEGAYKRVFSKKDVDLVVKVCHNAPESLPPSSESLSKYLVVPTYDDRLISIQAKANRNKIKQALDFFYKKFGKAYCKKWDIIDLNVGWINNKPVIFDCLGESREFKQ